MGAHAHRTECIFFGARKKIPGDVAVLIEGLGMGRETG